MDSNYKQLSGPDFLDQLSHIAHGLGEHINADEYGRRSLQWKADQVELDFTRARVEELERQLATSEPAAQAASRTGAITPTDQRH